MATQFISPIGRIVQGSTWKPTTTDQGGQPLTYKSGANMGQPREEYFFALAVEKSSPDWPAFQALLQQTAQASFPGGEWQRPNFSWKVKDGDGIDQNGRSNAEKDGFKGHWVISFKSGFPSNTIYRGQIIEPNRVRCGDYARVMGTLEGNGGGKGNGPAKPGLYINHNGIEFIGHGQEIVGGPDLQAAFSAAPANAYRPAGISDMPLGAAPAAAAAPSSFGGAPGAAAPAALPGFGGGVATPGPAAVAFGYPNAAAMAPAPAVPAAAPGLPSTINGVATSEWLKQGWTEATLRQHGHIQ